MLTSSPFSKLDASRIRADIGRGAPAPIGKYGAEWVLRLYHEVDGFRCISLPRELAEFGVAKCKPRATDHHRHRRHAETAALLVRCDQLDGGLEQLNGIRVLGQLIVRLSNAIGYFDPESPVVRAFGDAQGTQSMRDRVRLVVIDTVKVALKSFELCSALRDIKNLNERSRFIEKLTDAMHLPKVQQRVAEEEAYVDASPAVTRMFTHVLQGFKGVLEMLHGLPVRRSFEAFLPASNA